MEKPTNLFSMGEVCKTLNVTRKMVLNYEQCGLICPDIKNGPNGNRYYTLDTMTQIRIIRLFQNYGLSLSEIREYFSGNVDLLSLIHRLEALRDELDKNIQSLYERVNLTPYQIKEITVPAQTAYAQTFISTDLAEKTNFLRNTALEALTQYGTDLSRRQYFSEFTYDTPDNVTFYAAVPKDSKGAHIIRLPAIRGLCAYHHGSYESLCEAYTQLLDFAKENHLAHSGRFRSIYLEGPPQHKDSAKFITQLILFLQ